MRRVIRTSNLFQELAARFISYFERRDPEALLDLEKENLRKLIGRINERLVSHAALSEHLIMQVSRGVREQADLNEKIRPLMRAGHDKAAACYALQLQQVCAQLDEDRKQLEAADQTYRNLVRARDACIAEAIGKIEQARRRSNGLKIDEAVADLECIAAAMVSELGNAGDSCNRLRELVVEARHRAATRVARCGLGATKRLPD